MNDKKTIHPHDKFFKDAFSRISVVRSFIDEYLAQEESALIDQDTLEAIKDSHINLELQEFFSDAVYAALTPDGSNQVYLLFEHKSYEDLQVGAQVLENIAMVFQYHRRQHGRKGTSPIIFPILIYQGSSGRNPTHKPITYFRPFETGTNFLTNLNLRFVFFELQFLKDDDISFHYSQICSQYGTFQKNPGCNRNIKGNV